MPPLDLTTLSAASLAWCLGLHCSPWDPTDCLMLPEQRALHQAVARILPLTADSSAELSAPTISGLTSPFKEGQWLWGTKQWLGIRKMQVGGHPTADNTGSYSLSLTQSALHPSFPGSHPWLSGKGVYQPGKRHTLTITMTRILDTRVTHNGQMPKATWGVKVGTEKGA